MALDNLSDILNPLNQSFLDVLPPELISKIGGLITILKAAGIIFIAYVAFLIIKWLLTIRRTRRINKIYKKVKIMDKKLDVLLGKKRLKDLEKEFEAEKKRDSKKEKNKKKKRNKFIILF